MKQSYIFLAVVFILFLLTGCTNGAAGGPDDAEKLSEEFPPNMSGAVIAEDKTYRISEGNTKWERKQGLETEVVMTDAASPPQLAETVHAIKAEPNTTIQIEIEQDPDLSIYLWDETNRVDEIELTDNQFSAPSSRGRYVYEVFAKWQNGEVSYTFVLKVK